jgi:hypothetical protein
MTARGPRSSVRRGAMPETPKLIDAQSRGTSSGRLCCTKGLLVIEFAAISREVPSGAARAASCMRVTIRECPANRRQSLPPMLTSPTAVKPICAAARRTARNALCGPSKIWIAIYRRTSPLGSPNWPRMPSAISDGGCNPRR